jgi:hypothetical protein
MMMAITGPFVLLYVPGKLFVYSDAAATANNILTHESLFRAYIVIGIISELLFIATVLVLYKLLKEVNLTLAFVMVLLVLLDAPTSFLSVANQIATLAFVKGADFLSVFDKPQRDALATLFINIDKHGILVSEFFWGAWLLPLGILVYRSGFLPRLIGVWLFINGIAYIIISFTGMLLPQYLKMVNDVALPVLFGELAFALWLLIAGAKPKPLVNTA